ncbi:PP2C family protein-serine/threonine phosphatase [Streptomyces sp. NPDC002004]
MGLQRLYEEHRWSRWPKRALVAVPFAIIAAVTVLDLVSPPYVHLGPFLVAAPAITASFAGPRLTGFVGAVAVLAQVLVATLRTTVTDLNHTVQIIALVLISAIVTFFAHLREQHEQEVTQLRSVAEAAQRVVLRPLPRQVGPLRVASVYLAAEAEAQIGGDLYAVARTTDSTRLIIGDVRGKGLEAVGDAALVLGAFRAAAHLRVELPVLVSYLEGAVIADPGESGVPGEGGGDRGEAFTTAAVLDVPDAEAAIRLISCGHPPPLLVRDGKVVPLQVSHPAPPLGLAAFSGTALHAETFPFEVGDIVLLYTDGVIEARDDTGAFYPLAERVSDWACRSPRALLDRVCADLLAHAGGTLGDDAALVAIERLPWAPPSGAGGG